MRRLIELYLPVLFPSWRFFAEIGAGPRVDVQVNGGAWAPVSEPPSRETWADVVLRLFWNPRGNERLFLVTCAERILTERSARAEAELVRRLAGRVEGRGKLVFRIRLVDADGEDAAYVSQLFDV